eukprot:3841437-Rhodomonas_salina.2
MADFFHTAVLNTMLMRRCSSTSSSSPPSDPPSSPGYVKSALYSPSSMHDFRPRHPLLVCSSTVLGQVESDTAETLLMVRRRVCWLLSPMRSRILLRAAFTMVLAQRVALSRMRNPLPTASSRTHGLRLILGQISNLIPTTVHVDQTRGDNLSFSLNSVYDCSPESESEPERCSSCPASCDANLHRDLAISKLSLAAWRCTAHVKTRAQRRENEQQPAKSFDRAVQELGERAIGDLCIGRSGLVGAVTQRPQRLHRLVVRQDRVPAPTTPLDHKPSFVQRCCSAATTHLPFLLTAMLRIAPTAYRRANTWSSTIPAPSAETSAELGERSGMVDDSGARLRLHGQVAQRQARVNLAQRILPLQHLSAAPLFRSLRSTFPTPSSDRDPIILDLTRSTALASGSHFPTRRGNVRKTGSECGTGASASMTPWALSWSMARCRTSWSMLTHPSASAAHRATSTPPPRLTDDSPATRRLLDPATSRHLLSRHVTRWNCPCLVGWLPGVVSGEG